MADDAPPIGGLANLTGLERLDHRGLPDHAAESLVALDDSRIGVLEAGRICRKRAGARPAGRAVAHADDRPAAHRARELA